jgi:hypothetical protein
LLTSVKTAEIMKKGLLQGVVLLGIGAFVIYWAMTHSPKAGLGQMLSNELSGSYTMSETAYYVSLAVGAVVALLGVMGAYKSMK